MTFEELAVILTKWWGNSIPESAKQCRTTLIPKTVDELKNLSNWRPITIGKLFSRLYPKIRYKCLRKNIHLDERRKGFVPVDGCFENVNILQQIIKTQRQKKKEYNIAFIDLAKAFYTVSHISIVNGLKRKGIPSQVISAILELYTDSFTSITVGEKTTRRIRINSGIKQECALSPLLFNLIFDKLIVNLKNLGIGVKINE